MSAPERRPAAILYVELRNFTRLSETLEAPQVLQLANEFFSFTGKHIGERGGQIVLSLAFRRAIGATVKTLGAEELPPLELSRRPPIAIYGIVLNTRLDFT